MTSRSKYTFTLSDEIVEKVRHKSPNAKMLSRTVESLLAAGLNVFKDATIDFEMVIKSADDTQVASRSEKEVTNNKTDNDSNPFN